MRGSEYETCGAGAGLRLSLAKEFQKHGAEVAALVEPVPERYERAVEILGDGFRRLAHHGELEALAETVDAAVVLTPDHTHAEIATDLLAWGISVYLEKPIAISIEDCDRILRAARDAVAAALAATHSIRNGSLPEVVPELDPELRAYFEAGQPCAR